MLHNYDRECHCSNCIAYEKRLKASIYRPESKDIKSAPHNIEPKELKNFQLGIKHEQYRQC